MRVRAKKQVEVVSERHTSAFFIVASVNASYLYSQS